SSEVNPTYLSSLKFSALNLLPASISLQSVSVSNLSFHFLISSFSIFLECSSCAFLWSNCFSIFSLYRSEDDDLPNVHDSLINRLALFDTVLLLITSDAHICDPYGSD